MKKSFLIISLLILISCSTPPLKEVFLPGKVWNDTDGNPINAHGGGILHHNGSYYWFGEIKKGRTWLVPGQNWECYRVKAGGVSCYVSRDLYRWKYLGVALAPDTACLSSDIHTGKVLERPKVIFNEKTGKFVMWLHIDSEDYQYARAGVATSNTPEGPYRYLGSIRPNGQMSRDMTLFKDDDGKAYHIFSSEDNATMHISLLTDDYLRPSGFEKRILIGRSREAPALFKRKGKYYLISSACTGWSPNAAAIAVADSVPGDWKELGNPCTGPDSDSTYHAQSTFVLPLPVSPDHFIFMADRWNKTDLPGSRYVWLPLTFVNDSAKIEWKDEWRIDE